MNRFKHLAYLAFALCSIVLAAGVASAEGSKNLPAMVKKPVNLEAQAIIDGLSPMPPDPRIIGIRYVYYHALQHLREPMESWLNPNNLEQYSYRTMPQFAPDPIPVLKVHAALYEQIHQDYKELLRRDDIDQLKQEAYMVDSESKLLPFHLRFHLMSADAIRQAYSSPSFRYTGFLRLLHEQRRDDRYITHFFFWTVVDKAHKDLEALSSMSKSSKRGHQMIQQILGSIQNDLAAGYKKADHLLDLTLNYKESDEITNEMGDALEAVKDFDSRMTYRLKKLNDGLIRSTQIANDVVNRKELKIRSKQDLADQMRKLGIGLRHAISEVEGHSNQSADQNERDDRFYRERPGHQVVDPIHELNSDAGISRWSPLPHHLRGEFMYSSFSEALIVQHILTASSMMAKIKDLTEGKGSLGENAAQELRYQSAKLLARIGSKKNELTVSPAAEMNRQDFASPAVRDSRLQIEEEMWSIFFSAAQLKDMRPESPSCESLLAPPEKPTKDPYRALKTRQI